MTYPPTLPAAGRSDSTLAAGNHADDHNKLRTAIASLIEILGADPSGSYADLSSRLLGVAAGADQTAIDTFNAAVAAVTAISGIDTIDDAVSALIETIAGPKTQAALQTSIEGVAGDVASDLVGTTVFPRLERVLAAGRFDSQGQGQLAVLAGKAAARYVAATEVDEAWADLAGVNAANVAVASNKLGGSSSTQPNAAKKALTYDATVGMIFTARVYIASGDFVGAGFTGTDAAPIASSTDAYMIGSNSTLNPTYHRGTGAGGTGQSVIDAVTMTNGEECIVTGAVLPDGQISVTLTRLSTGFTYVRVGASGPVLASSLPGGVVGNWIAYPGRLAGGGKVGPVALIKTLGGRKTKTLGGENVAAHAMHVRHYNADNSDRHHLIIAPGNDPTVPAPLVVYPHNSGGSELNSVQDARIIPLVNGLLGQGYNVVMANASGSAWGNDTSRGQYVAAYEWARSLVAVSSVALVGQSMCGQVVLNLLPRREIPNVQAVLLVAPVTSLDDLWVANAGTYSPNIRTAFGIAADGSDYETKTAGYRPEDREGWEFRGVPVMVVASPDDTTCHIANAEALIDKLTPYTPEAVLIESTGTHMAAEQFNDAVTHGMPFLRRYL